MDQSCQKFGIDLLKSISSDHSDKNVIYSPMSVYFALGMTLCGAHGETSTEMAKTLHWNLNESQSYHSEISKAIVEFNQGDHERFGNLVPIDPEGKEIGVIKIANKMFMEQSFKMLDSFKSVINAQYDGGIDLVDFKVEYDKSRLAINSWVEKQTNSKIEDLLSPGTVNALTKLIIVNAIYFKGSWIKEFNLCGKQDFHSLDKSVKSVDMINKTTDYPYLENNSLGFRAVQVPFERIGDNNYSMMIILPDEKYFLPKLEKILFEKEWNSVLKNDLFQIVSVDITMPKFRIESSFNLKEVLQSLGMVTSFTGKADFSLITGAKDLMIDDVVHKAFIDVDENGVEAAAATAIVINVGCYPGMYHVEPIKFKCDHPFMFALLKEGSLPIFLGHLVDC